MVLAPRTDDWFQALSAEHADVAQLVERNLAKVEVASSSLVVRSAKVSDGKAPADGYRPGLFVCALRGAYDQVRPVRRS